MTHAYGKSLLPSTVGFDRLLSTLNEFDQLFEHKKPQSYPPYNILKLDDDNYQIQIAVAGFDKSDIVIESKHNQLTVNGAIRTEESNAEYLHRGLAARNFSHSFTLSDTIIVKSADMVNGLLKINLENIIPDEKKPKVIEIN